MKINSIDSIIEILNNQFLKFFDESEWIISSQSDNFDFIFDEHMDTKTPLKFESTLSNSNSNSYSESNSNSKSKLKLNHKTYKIILPHESIDTNINLSEVLQKYRKRVNRFNDLLKSFQRKIIYIGCNKIIKNRSVYENELKMCLDNYNCINYSIVFVQYNDYPTIGQYSWHRNWIPWNRIFSKCI